MFSEFQCGISHFGIYFRLHSLDLPSRMVQDSIADGVLGHIQPEMKQFFVGNMISGLPLHLCLIYPERRDDVLEHNTQET